MVLGPLGWILQFFVAEDISKHSVLVRDFFICFGLFDDRFLPPDLGGKYCLVGIVCSEHNG